jgi:hypothetical protein
MVRPSAIPLVRLALDRPGHTKSVGPAIRAILHGAGERWVVAAYVTRDEIQALKPRQGHRHRPKLLCDPFQGNCNPDLLRALNRHADVYCRANTHAKVYRGPRGLAIGSANMSLDALAANGRLLEGMVVLEDATTLDQADAWFAELIRDAGTMRLSDLTEAMWVSIELAYAAKGGTGRGGARSGARKGRPARARHEIATVIRDLTLLTGGLAFEFIADSRTEFTRRDAQALAKQTGVELSADWEFTETITHDPHGAIRDGQDWQGQEVVAMRGEGDYYRNSLRPVRITAIQPSWRLITARGAGRRRVIFYYEKCQSRFRFSAAPIRRLIADLNAGIKRRSLKDLPPADALMPPPSIAALLT